MSTLLIKVTISANEFLSASDANKIASTRPFSTVILPSNAVSAVSVYFLDTKELSTNVAE